MNVIPGVGGNFGVWIEVIGTDGVFRPKRSGLQIGEAEQRNRKRGVLIVFVMEFGEEFTDARFATGADDSRY